MSDVLFEVGSYKVVPTSAALNEMGSANDAQGYAVVNIETGVVEHTAICLPATMFQADQFNRMLTQLRETDAVEDALSIMGDVDASIN